MNPTLRKYDRIAKRYEFIDKLIQVGFDYRNRDRAIDHLRLSPGDVVLDLCCGPGNSFRPLQEHIGPKGRIIAVDLSPTMLQLAREKTLKFGWENIELIESDGRFLELDEQVDAIFMAYGWLDDDASLQVVRRAVSYLGSGGRVCFLEWRLPLRWYGFLVRPITRLVSPLVATSYDELDWHPEKVLGALLQDSTVESFFLDNVVCVSGLPGPRLLERRDSHEWHCRVFLAG